MDLSKLCEVGRKATAASRVSDSADRRARIMDARRRMAERRANAESNAESNEEGTKTNRISDSRTPMRGIAAKRAAAMQGLRKKQDSAAKTYYALRKRIKDELSETESTDEAIETAIDIMNNEVEVSPADVLAAVVEVISEVADTLPQGDGGAADDELPAEDFDEGDEEVSDSLRRRAVVRRRMSDSARRAAIRRRVLDAAARRRAAARRIRDARARRASVLAARRKADSEVSASRRMVARRAADSASRRIVRRG